MVAVLFGRWQDYSQPEFQRINDSILTLSLRDGNFLLATLTLLVTLAGTAFWRLTAFVIHSVLAGQGEHANGVRLQHQVVLRNTSTSAATILQAAQIYLAAHLRGRGAPKSEREQEAKRRGLGLFGSTAIVAVPAVIIWVSFAVASIFVSGVANKTNGAAIARIDPENCGFWGFSQSSDVVNVAKSASKVLNDTIQARSYISTFYANASGANTVVSRSNFLAQSLAHNYNLSGACPIPAADRCILGANKALVMETNMLDTTNALGINAVENDRVNFRLTTTCSPVRVDDLSNTTTIANRTYIQMNLGSIPADGTNFTYQYNVESVHTDLNYMLQTRYHYADDPNTMRGWKPNSDFNRSDADVSVYFLSQNNVVYLGPVLDPWFSANGSNTATTMGQKMVLPDRLLNVMVCADSYTICNPGNGACTRPGGQYQLAAAVQNSSLGLSAEQRASAGRLLVALQNSSTPHSVDCLNEAALWATNVVYTNISPVLPSDQWVAEALGWFQTNLAKLQAYAVTFASNTGYLGPGGKVISPFDANFGSETDIALFRDDATVRALQGQCQTQLVKTSGEVQNFSVAGVAIVASVCVFLVILNLSLEFLVNTIKTKRGWNSPSKRARQADDKLHLLRMALGPPKDHGYESPADGKDDAKVQKGWADSFISIPTVEPGVRFHRPAVDGDLAYYPKEEAKHVHSGEDKEAKAGGDESKSES